MVFVSNLRILTFNLSLISKIGPSFHLFLRYSRVSHSIPARGAVSRSDTKERREVNSEGERDT